MNQQVLRYVAGVGAANVDVYGRSRSPIVMRDSNPGYLGTSVGGVTRNILENLARQGVRTALLTAVGDDVYGEKILRDSAAAGIDVSHVLLKPGVGSSCYIAMLDERGDMMLAMSDMRIISDLTGEYLNANRALLQNAAAIVCDACLPCAFLDELVSGVASGVRVLIDPVSTAYARSMEPIVGKFFGIKPNEMELAILSGKPTETETQVELACEALLSRGVTCIAVSRGSRGCYYADASGARMFRALRPVERMANATGAGDAFLAGFVHGLIDGVPLERQLDYALASGITAIESLSTINPEMSDARVKENIELYRVL